MSTLRESGFAISPIDRASCQHRRCILECDDTPPIFYEATCRLSFQSADTSAHSKIEAAKDEIAGDSLKENWNDQDGDNVHDFDHRIDRWSGGVFVGIAHRVAGHGRGVRE